MGTDICEHCGDIFYYPLHGDGFGEPVTCPRCGTVYEVSVDSSGAISLEVA